MSLIRRAEVLRIRQEEEISEKTPHRVLLENAFREISLELDANGFTPHVDELRKKHLDTLRSYWDKVLHAYTLECEKRGKQNFSGAEITIGQARVIVTAIKAGYVDNGVRLEIESRSLTETDSLSLIVDQNGQVDGVFAPEIHSDVRDDDLETRYVVRFSGNKISYFHRNLLRAGMGGDERTLQFN